jgi:hypothetical protein
VIQELNGRILRAWLQIVFLASVAMYAPQLPYAKWGLVLFPAWLWLLGRRLASLVEDRARRRHLQRPYRLMIRMEDV